jgi:hypothetical protein
MGNAFPLCLRCSVTIGDIPPNGTAEVRWLLLSSLQVSKAKLPVGIATGR